MHVGNRGGHNQSIIPYQSFSSGSYSLFAVCRQRKLGGSGMTSIQTPFRFAVSNDEGARGCHSLDFRRKVPRWMLNKQLILKGLL